MLFLSLDQALELEKAAKNMKERLVIRYMIFNGLSPMEISAARIEDLNPKTRILFMPRRHWKNNETTDIDPETMRLQIIYSGARKKGPLIRSNRGGHYERRGLWTLVKSVARRTTIPDKQKVCPLILKRTFARIYLKTPGNTIAALQRAFGHKHLWSTARYLRFVLEDVRLEKARMMERIEHAKTEQPRLVS